MTESNSTNSTQVDNALSLGTAGDILSLPTVSKQRDPSSSPPLLKPRITLDTSNLGLPGRPSLSRMHSEPPMLKPARNPPPRTRLREIWPFRLMISSKEKARMKIEEGGRERREQREVSPFNSTESARRFARSLTTVMFSSSVGEARSGL